MGHEDQKATREARQRRGGDEREGVGRRRGVRESERKIRLCEGAEWLVEVKSNG
jgi:hypothetical protein